MKGLKWMILKENKLWLHRKNTQNNKDIILTNLSKNTSVFNENIGKNVF